MVDLTVEYTAIRDYTMPQRDGSFLKQKQVTFFIGKFGPFTEYFDFADFTEFRMRERVDALKQQVEALHR